jgi:hypothetical protein
LALTRQYHETVQQKAATIVAAEKPFPKIRPLAQKIPSQSARDPGIEMVYRSATQAIFAIARPGRSLTF